MKKITIWERFYPPTKEEGAYYSHNHIQEGWSDDTFPECGNKRWSTYAWRKTYGYLDGIKVVPISTKNTKG